MVKIPSLILGLALSSRLLASGYDISAHYKIGGDASHWDYVTYDADTHYVYVAHATRFEVVNTTTGEKVGEIGPGKRAHGIAIVASLHKGFATFGNDNAVVVFDTHTLKILDKVPTTGKNPDAIQYDALDTKLIYAVNGASGNVTLIDPRSDQVVGDVKLVDGKLEEIAFDGRGKAYVNNEEKSSVHVFDTHSLKALATWSLAPGDGGTGAAIDPETHRLFSVCSNNKLIVINTDTGKVVATPQIGDDPDGVAFDPATKQLFSSNADQTLAILHEDTPDSYSLVQTVKTARGANKLAVDTSTGKIYLPTAQFEGADDDKTPPKVVPGTFEILVLSK